MTKLQIPSYPERNFGGNQLLDSSMSLAPLCPGLTNDLHVSTATDLHQDFSWLHPAQVKLTIFRVPLNVLDLTSLSDDQERAMLHPSRGQGSHHSLSIRVERQSLWFDTTTLAHSIDSLVRVSRRVIKDHSNQGSQFPLPSRSTRQVGKSRKPKLTTIRHQANTSTRLGL